jgi:hypothetical protein
VRLLEEADGVPVLRGRNVHDLVVQAACIIQPGRQESVVIARSVYVLALLLPELL